MDRLRPEMLETLVEYVDRSRMANYAENFFRRMDDQKRYQIETRINLSITAMRKFYRKIKPYVKKTAVKFIVYSTNPNGTHFFTSKSFRKAKNEWIRLRHECDWYSIFAVNHDDFRWKVHWFYHDCNRERIIKFFDKDGEEICKILIEFSEWWKQT